MLIPPSQPVIEKLSDTSVKVSWSVAEGGLPITFFKVSTNHFTSLVHSCWLAKKPTVLVAVHRCHWPWPNCSHFHAVFGRIWPYNRLAPFGVGTPSLGNPGDATGCIMLVGSHRFVLLRRFSTRT